MRDALTRLRMSAFLGLTLIMALGPAPGRAQDGGGTILLRALAAPLDPLRPGGIHTIPFYVENRGDSAVFLTEAFEAPRGWSVITGSAGFELKAGESVTRLVSVSLSPAVEAGVHEIRYSVTAPGGAPFAAAIQLGVAERKAFAVHLLDAPQTLLAGASSTLRFLVQNTGNLGISLYLQASTTADGQAAPESTLVYVRPGEARQLAVTARSLEHVRSKRQIVVSLTATAVNDTAISRQASTIIEIIPTTSEDGVDPYVRLPVRAAVRFAGEEGRTGFQGELAGMGYLGSTRQDRFEVFLRSPNLQSISILGQIDEYRAALEGQWYSIVLGDATYALTPLTEYGRFAFGGAGKVRFDDVELGGFYNRNRLAAIQQEEVAGFAALSIAPEAKVSVQYLGKSEQFQSSIASFRTLIEPSRNAQIDAEFARSFTDGGSEDAYSLRMSGRSAAFLYDLRYVMAGPDYKGYYRDTDHRAATLVVYPWGLLRLEAYYRDDDRNLDRNPDLYAAPRQKYLQAGAGYGNYLTVLYKTSSLVDQLESKNFDRHDNTLLFRSGYSAPDMTLFAEAEFGTIAERVYDTSGPYRRTMLFAGHAPWSGHQYSVNLEYVRDLQILTGEPVDRVSGTLNARIALWGHTWVDGHAHLSRTISEPHQTYSIVEGGVLHELPFGHTIGARGRVAQYTPSYTNAELAFLLEYTVPFGIPVSRDTRIGALSGRIVDDETGVGIEDALVSAGGQVVATDESGRFAFPGLAPGPHHLMVDQSTLPAGVMIGGERSAPVLVTGGEEREIELRAVRSAGFGGTVILAEPDSAAPADSAHPRLVDSGVQAGVVLEALSGDLVVRRLSDQWGKFEFRDLRPGVWRVQISGGEIPAGRRPVQESYHLSLRAGEHQSVDVRLVPRKKVIRIMDGGVLK